MDTHQAERNAVHDCGGTILSGPDHIYCDRCRAFTYDDDDTLPTGTDPAANRQAWDDGEDCSPDDDQEVQS